MCRCPHGRSRAQALGRHSLSSGVTLSAYITIILHKPLHKHDPLTADLSTILIKQKNSSPSAVPGHSWPGCSGL